MKHDVAIDIQRLWKRYGLPLPRAIARMKGLFSSRKEEENGHVVEKRGSWALRDISLELRRGETVGVIGQNGAGKSTLLKVLAGVTPPTKGHVEVHGTVFPMIELNAGLHTELTGRENVRLLGTIMGLSRREMEDKIPDIEAFCALKEWFDKPVRTYSSGMFARLGFGVAMNIDADILLIDEVLAVGDLSFQGKCFQRLETMRASGVTILLVSHNLRQIDRLCDRVALLRSGRCEALGKTDEVVQTYFDQSQERITRSLEKQGKKNLGVAGDITVSSIEFLDESGDLCESVEMLHAVTVRISYVARRKVTAPVFVIGILTPEMFEVTNFNTANIDGPQAVEGHGVVECRIPEVRLLPGNYGIKCIIRDHRGLKHYRNEHAAWFRVFSPTYESLRGNAGFFYTPAQWTFPEKG